MDERMTVVEYATKHADECTCGIPRREHIQTHIDALIQAAVYLDKTLWEVGVDADGRASLIWRSYPIEAWRALLAESGKILVLKSLLGLSR